MLQSAKRRNPAQRYSSCFSPLHPSCRSFKRSEGNNGKRYLTTSTRETRDPSTSRCLTYCTKTTQQLGLRHSARKPDSSSHPTLREHENSSCERRSHACQALPVPFGPLVVVAQAPNLDGRAYVIEDGQRRVSPKHPIANPAYAIFRASVLCMKEYHCAPSTS